MNMIEVDALGVSLGGRAVLSDVSLQLREGEVVGLLGPNGAGKSTLMRALVGQGTYAGRISIAGRNLLQMSPLERARQVAYLPQQRVIGWPISVHDLVALGRLPWQGTPAAQHDAAVCRAALALMDVAELALRPATALSGGEQARVLAARAVAQDTPVIVADEPAAGLDPAHQMAMMQAFRTLATSGRSLLVSLHDLTLAARWCDRLIVAAQGRVAAEGVPVDVMTPQLLRNVFGIVARIDHEGGRTILTPLELARP